jgi:hypothetical protein
LESIRTVRARVEEDEPLNLDRLLLWLSAKEQGSWSQFRAAVEEFCTDKSDASPDDPDYPERRDVTNSGLPIYQHVRLTLQRLAHAEFYTAGAENGWRIVPPSLAFLADRTDTGLLCGARSPAILERLSHVSDFELLSSEFEGMPQRILLRGNSGSALVASAEMFGLQIQRDAPVALLSVTPGVRDPKNWRRSQMPETPGWSVQRFSISRRQWLEVPSSDARKAYIGLFRFALRHQLFYYLRWRNCSYSVPVQVGKYAIMRRQRSVLQYDSRRRVFSTFAILRPPLLIERALVLCSGKLGQFDRAAGRIEYTEVPPDVANLAAQLLEQEIR